MSGGLKLGVAGALVLSAMAFVPGAAGARVGTDPCTVAVGQDPAPFTETGRICAPVQTVDAFAEDGLGAPASYEGVASLPSTEPSQCPAGTYIPGTVSYSNLRAKNWEWDYWAENGEWILWTGLVDGTWPRPVTTLPGLQSIRMDIKNWNVYYPVRGRAYWNCKPIPSGGSEQLSSPAATPPRIELSGTDGDDNVRGDEAHNALIGGKGDDRLRGQGGNDHLQSGAGSDELLAGADDDLVHAGGGDDVAVGATGSDDLLTGKGDDISRGGGGQDQLFDDQGRDRLAGGPGDDNFSTHDGNRDVIHCGTGEDVAMVDRFDVVTGCEHVWRSRRDAPKRMPNI